MLSSLQQNNGAPNTVAQMIENSSPDNDIRSQEEEKKEVEEPIIPDEGMEIDLEYWKNEQSRLLAEMPVSALHSL